MFLHFIKYEIKHWLKTPMLYVFLLIIALLTWAQASTDNVSFGVGGQGNVFENAPTTIQQFYGIFGIFGMLFSIAFFNSTAGRDFNSNFHQIIFSKPISKFSYFFARFFGTALMAIIPYLGIVLGYMIAGVFHYNPDEKYTHFLIEPHIASFMLMVIPNTLIVGSFLYVIAMLTRSTVTSFIAGFGIIIFNAISQTLTRNLSREWIATLVDPFGNRALRHVTKYWTPAEMNSTVVWFSNEIVTNRIFWLGLGTLALLFGYKRFTFEEKNKPSAKKTAEDVFVSKSTSNTLPPVTTVYSGFSVWASQLILITKLEFKSILNNTVFKILAAISIILLIVVFAFSSEAYGGVEYPVTYNMIDIIKGSMNIFIIAILIFYSGVLVWKERDAKMNDIYDALPYQTSISVLSKFFALHLTLAFLYIISISISIIYQATQGYYHFELMQYVKSVMIEQLLYYTLVSILCFFIHSILNNRYIAYFAVIVILAVNLFLWQGIKVQTNMVKLFNVPSFIYSDMNGYGPAVKSIVWFYIYWILFAILLLFASIGIWTRGREIDLTNRLQATKHFFGKKKIVIGVISILWILCGSFIYYNTKILNKIVSSKELEALQVRYEKDYKAWENKAQPKVTDVEYTIDLTPEARSLEVNGKIWIKNKTNETINDLFINEPQNAKYFSLTLKGSSIKKTDKELKLKIHQLAKPLLPGDSLQYSFQTKLYTNGFENEVEDLSLVENGTFFNNSHFCPEIGYQTNGELNDPDDRKKYGLSKKTRAPKLTTTITKAQYENYISNNSDWVNVKTVMSTSLNQTAIAPGSLIKQWTANNKNYFEYKLDHYALNFYSFISAKYEVKRDKYKGIDVEIYYDKAHAYNVDKMISSIKKSLEYYTTNYGKYYHKQCRIIEFPRYQSFAQAFPGTMPYSESIGFIADLRDTTAVDMVYYVVAHEMGHQWWAHQVIGPSMQGSEMLSETFAQYSAMMVMEKAYGKAQMKKFLRYELNQYLESRGREREEENPLMKCENQQYIHYNKGSVVMYYLKEMIGEQNVNKSLKMLIDSFAYRQPPYPTSWAAVNAFKLNTPDSLQYLIKDLFEDITLFDNRITEATSKKLANDKYEVSIKTFSRKVKSDGKGNETEVAINDFIEFGIYEQEKDNAVLGNVIYSCMKRVNKKDNTYTFIVDKEPKTVYIDPRCLLVDRVGNDNKKQL